MTDKDPLIEWLDNSIQNFNNDGMLLPLRSYTYCREVTEVIESIKEKYLELNCSPQPKPKEPKDYLGKWYKHKKQPDNCCFYPLWTDGEKGVHGFRLRNDFPGPFTEDWFECQVIDEDFEECEPPQLPEGVFIYGVNV